MGIYIGVYLKVPLKAVQKPKEGYTCPNTACDRHGARVRGIAAGCHFCPFCGTAVVPNEGTEEKLMGYQFSDLDNANENKMMTIDSTYGADQGYQFVLPNSREGSSIHIEDSDIGEFPYPPNAEQEDRKRFNEHYGPLAEAIMKEFPGTELKIGIVGYY